MLDAFARNETTDSLLPSPFGRRAGDEGLRAESVF
ncbi:MAG: hypothetical protein QOK48_485 [Blastocatellia bacterium]|jgi:hypothetical protein|nr:hypothetical protein [Blastocatellia bacterium]